MRKYIATWDDGHDWGEFEFYSEHRAKSKANIEDARSAAKSKYGHKRASLIEIKSTQLCLD